MGALACWGRRRLWLKPGPRYMGALARWGRRRLWLKPGRRGLWRNPGRGFMGLLASRGKFGSRGQFVARRRFQGNVRLGLQDGLCFPRLNRLQLRRHVFAKHLPVVVALEWRDLVLVQGLVQQRRRCPVDVAVAERLFGVDVPEFCLQSAGEHLLMTSLLTRQVRLVYE